MTVPQICSRIFGSLFLAPLYVLDGFRRHNPLLLNNVIYRNLHTLGVVFGEQSQMMSADFQLSPNAFV